MSDTPPVLPPAHPESVPSEPHASPGRDTFAVLARAQQALDRARATQEAAQTRALYVAQLTDTTMVDEVDDAASVVLRDLFGL